MDIFLKIFENKNSEPDKTEYHGNWAFETMILKKINYYYGKTVADKVSELLRERIKK